ncbi:MAG: sigma-54-dependent Fis family transcriptional regulator [Rhodobacteraceae bacterium]|nr:sigma-54-dependent Fis family transcriptional regulator [Paracoccaceae bacterium]
MIYLNTENSNFLSDLKTACCARGLDFAEFHEEDFIPSKKLTNVFVAEKSSPEQIGGNEEIYSFLKTHFFKRAVFIKLNCSHFSVIEHLNGAILEVQIPIEYSSSSKEVVYFIHYVIELIASEKANLPCANPQTASLVKLFQNHSFSNRNEGPFIAINCAAIPEQMLESTLFGHEKGAFTGALQQNIGLFRAASGGTILLDEISEMPLALQTKLLRVIQEKRVMAVGGSSEVEIDARIIATTNRHMPEEVKAGRFREDLFYRLNVFPVKTLALAHRAEDIIPIAAHMLSKLDKQCNTNTHITSDAIDALTSYEWPGNARELGNVIHRGHILAAKGKITAADLIFDLSDGVGSLNTADVLASMLHSDQENEVQL